MKIIGLTGNIGSGKSSVSNILKQNGAYIIDADKIAHEVIEPNGAAFDEVLQSFGDEIKAEQGYINRKILGAIVFNNKEKLEQLIKITHKHIIPQMLGELKHAEMLNHQLVVMDAPLLIEANLHEKCDEVWVVVADESVRLKRIIERDNILEAAAKNKMEKQTASEELIKYADFIIENNGSKEELIKTVTIMIKRCLEMEVKN